MRVVYAAETPYMNFRLVLAGAGNVVGQLHSHQRIHFHAESLLDAQRHFARQVGLAIQRTGQGRRET